jgi:hypothetical protein
MRPLKSAKPATDDAVNGLRSMQSAKMLDQANLKEVISQVVARRGAISESADNYQNVVLFLNDRWRVIECSAGIQWIVQYRASAETYSRSHWTGRSFCRTREALIRSCISLSGTAHGLEMLPERIGPLP